MTLRLIALFLLMTVALPVGRLSAQNPEPPPNPLLQSLDEEEEKTVPPELVIVRGWGNSKFGRMVFDWQQPVGFTAKIVGDQLRITFDRPLKSELKDVRKRLEGYFRDLQIQAKGKVVSANLRGYYSVRSFSNENAVVVDLVPEDGPHVQEDEDPDAWLKRTPRIAVRAGEHPTFGRLVFDWEGDVGYDILRRGGVVRIRFDRPARIDMSRIAAALPGRVTAATSETRKSDVTVGMAVPANFEIRHFRDGHRIAFDILAPAPPKEEDHGAAAIPETHAERDNRQSHKSVDDGHEKKAEPKAEPVKLTGEDLRAKREAEKERRESAAKFGDAPLVTVDAERKGPALEIRFNWRKPVGAALYRRDDYAYLLFDDRARISVGGLRVVGDGFLEDVVQTDADRMSLIRMKVPRTLLASVTRSGTVWGVRFAPAALVGPLEKPVSYGRRLDSDGRPELLLDAKSLGRPHVFLDRLAGDVVNVYTVMEPGVGNRPERNLVDLDVLASALGLAIVPHRDDLRMLRSAEGLNISSPSGLMLSDPADIARRAPDETESDNMFGDLAKWTGEGQKDFEKAKQRHLQEILVAPDAQRNRARLQLARFYLANGMAADAMGVIEVALANEPKLESDARVRALRGAAHYLLRHYAQAAQEFDHPDFSKDPSIAPWRGGVAAARGDWAAANEIMKDARGFVAGLPAWLRPKFELVGAEAALAVRDAEGAKPWLNALRNFPLSVDDGEYYQFLLAHAQNLEGKTSAAKNAWRRLVATGNRNVRAKSLFALVNADLETGHATVKQAIERLEGLSFAWRGDSFEFDLKRRLGDLYAEDGDYRTSFLRLKQAASHFKDVDGAEAIAEDMRKRFKELFLDGGADRMDPVRALALYEEFRELTPAGTDGDEMIRKLADRLVKVDLLAEASRLLEHQVRYRLTGVERSRVGARLALIDLLNREPEKAKEALKLSEGDELPQELELDRRYLTARALGEMKQVDAALATLTGDVSYEAELLRLQVFWSNERWPDVSSTIRRIIPQQHADELSPKLADLVLRWAVALTMQNDVEGLIALRERFGAALAKTSYAEAFKAIAGVDVGEVPDFKALVDKTGDLKDFQSFMASYRDKIRSNALSTIN